MPPNGARLLCARRERGSGGYHGAQYAKKIPPPYVRLRDAGKLMVSAQTSFLIGAETDFATEAFAITSLAALALMMSVSTISAVKTLFVVADCFGGCN